MLRAIYKQKKHKPYLTLTLYIGFALSNLGCTNLFFYPMKQHVLSPKKIGIDYEDVYIKTTDGHSLHGWFLPATGKAKGTVLFLHGNAENISTHIGAVYWLPAKGFNVLLYDYRGYGKSNGALGIDTAITDVTSVIEFLTAQKDIDSSKLIIFGQSLGGAIATNAVANNQKYHNFAALIVESSFANFRGIAQEKLSESWLTWAFQWPLSLTITNQYAPLTAIKQIVDIPVLIIHGDKDRIIPIEHGKRLYKAANQPKTIWVIPNGRHIEAMTMPEYRIKFAKYLEAVIYNPVRKRVPRIMDMVNSSEEKSLGK